MRLLSLLFITLLFSCSTHIKPKAKVGTYVSPIFTTSSYWIEGPEGVVVVDVQFGLSAAEELLKRAEEQTKKKVVLAIVLHPNPDKFNGTEVFQKRGIRVITSKSVASYIPEVYELRRKWFYERFKPDFPGTLPKPEIEQSIPDTGVVELKEAGLTLKIHGMGKGCSYSHLVVEVDKHLFVGDLVTNGFHSWLELGFINDWIERINELQKLNPEFVHVGRGESGGPELLVKEKEYLEETKKLAKLAKGPKNLGDKILEKYPDLQYSNFVRLGQEEVFNKYHR